jgi:hypothetical protein
LKLWKALDDNKIKSAGTFSEILDCTMGLHNFKELFNSDPNYQIPCRNRTIPGEHVFKSREEKKSGIPDEPRQSMVNRASNVFKFKTSLLSLQNELAVAVGEGGGPADFFPTVIQRGKNLFNGAYVLQLRLQPGLVEDWFIRFKVGASYSYETHSGVLSFDQRKDCRCLYLRLLCRVGCI